MRVAVSTGLGQGNRDEAVSYVLEAERLGVSSVWSSEAWGTDAVTPLAYLAARTKQIKLGTSIMQAGTRSPALIAMTALTLAALSDDRFLLGLGTSGPQVMEGWHGVAFGKPLAKTREYVEIVRMVWKRERPVEHKGEYYQIPYAGPDATGLGKPLKSILHLDQVPARTEENLRVYVFAKLLIALLIDSLLYQAESFSPWGYPIQAHQQLAPDQAFA